MSRFHTFHRTFGNDVGSGICELSNSNINGKAAMSVGPLIEMQ